MNNKKAVKNYTVNRISVGVVRLKHIRELENKAQ